MNMKLYKNMFSSTYRARPADFKDETAILSNFKTEMK